MNRKIDTKTRIEKGVRVSEYYKQGNFLGSARTKYTEQKNIVIAFGPTGEQIGALTSMVAARKLIESHASKAGLA